MLLILSIHAIEIYKSLINYNMEENSEVKAKGGLLPLIVFVGGVIALLAIAKLYMG